MSTERDCVLSFLVPFTGFEHLAAGSRSRFLKKVGGSLTLTVILPGLRFYVRPGAEWALRPVVRVGFAVNS